MQIGLKAEGKFLKYCCKRYIQMSCRQRRIADVVILSLREATILTKGRGGGDFFRPFSIAFFCRTFGQIVFIHR